MATYTKKADQNTKASQPTYLDIADEAGIDVSTDAGKLAFYKVQFERWQPILGSYIVNRFDVNYRQYTAYSDVRGTDAKISDPVAPELVERMIQQMFQRPPKFYTTSRGRNLPKEITEIIEGTAQYMWTNPNIIQSSGSMREKLKVVGRELGVTGNAATETFFNAQADAPDFRFIPIEDVVFDPTKSLKRSKAYYILQYVSLKDIEDLAEVTVDGKVVSGRFKNVAEFKRQWASTINSVIRQEPQPYIINRSGQNVAQRPADSILLITRWEGRHCTRIANWYTIIEEYDNDILDDDPLDFIMDIEVPKQPYAFGLLDFLNGMTHAKDMLLNQIVDYGSKALNPPLYVDPSVAANPANRQSLRNAFKIGGIVMANPQMVNHLPMPNLPAMGFEFLTYIQQRAESVTGLSAIGNPSNPASKLAKTATEAQALVDQSSSPIQDRQINFEESIIEPVTNKMLKYMAALMGRDEVKEVFITGNSPKWVKVTRNMLQGKITLIDLIISGLITNEPTPGPDGQIPLDPTSQQPIQNPQTGYFLGSEADQLTTLMLKQGKKPEKEVIFDTNWVVRVETGSMAEQDSAKDVENLTNWVNFRLQFRIPTDLKKISEEIGIRMGIKNPEQYDMDIENTPPGQQPTMNASTLPFIFPKESIGFADLPPEGKMQMAGNAGIHLDPQSLMGTPADAGGRYPYAHTPQMYATGIAQPPTANPMNPNGLPQQNPSGPPGQVMPPQGAQALMQQPQPGMQGSLSPQIMNQIMSQMPSGGPGPGMGGAPNKLPNNQPDSLPNLGTEIARSTQGGMPSKPSTISGMPTFPGAKKKRIR